MKIVWKVLKWIGLSVAALIAMIILSGLVYKLFSSEPYKPNGLLVDIGGHSLHIVASGEKSSKPTLVIEGGGGLPTEFYHWLDEGLKDSMRVIRYDRAGLGHSDECSTPRDPETIVHELHTLLQKAGESPPYIMMGHSLGGPYIRVFTELYPKEVKAMFFLDATHPDHVERYNAPKQTDFIYKAYIWSIGVEAALADVGVIALFDKLFGFPYYGEGLPDQSNNRIKDFLRNGKSFRTYKEEIKYYYSALKRSGKIEDFGALPIRSYAAVSQSPETISEEEKANPIPKVGNHKEYHELSTNGKRIEIPSNHVTIFSNKENADVICKEVLKLYKEL